MSYKSGYFLEGGERVKTINQLGILALRRKSVYVTKSPAFRKHHPAAWIIHLSGVILLRLFHLGMFVYEPQKKGGPNGSRT